MFMFNEKIFQSSDVSFDVRLNSLILLPTFPKIFRFLRTESFLPIIQFLERDKKLIVFFFSSKKQNDILSSLNIPTFQCPFFWLSLYLSLSFS